MIKLKVKLYRLLAKAKTTAEKNTNHIKKGKKQNDEKKRSKNPVEKRKRENTEGRKIKYIDDKYAKLAERNAVNLEKNKLK